MRSKLSKAAIAAVALLVVAGCGSGGGTTGAAASKLTPPKIDKLAALGTGEGEVNLVAWAGYVENG